MKSYKIEADAGPITFAYNADLSGNVRIRSADVDARIPGRALLEFIAHVVRDAKIEDLEGVCISAYGHALAFLKGNLP